MEGLISAGLQEDCPFKAAEVPGEAPVVLTSETVGEVPQEDFVEYAGRLNTYLGVLPSEPSSKTLNLFLVAALTPSPETFHLLSKLFNISGNPPVDLWTSLGVPSSEPSSLTLNLSWRAPLLTLFLHPRLNSECRPLNPSPKP